jgi:hypothetical protein
MISLDTMAILIGLVLTIVAMVGTAVWTAGSVDKSTAVLANEIKHLVAAVSRLDSKSDLQGQAIQGLERRVLVLEKKET